MTDRQMLIFSTLNESEQTINGTIIGP